MGAVFKLLNTTCHRTRKNVGHCLCIRQLWFSHLARKTAHYERHETWSSGAGFTCNGHLGEFRCCIRKQNIQHLLWENCVCLCVCVWGCNVRIDLLISKWKCMNELSGGCRVKAWCWGSHLAINMNKIHQLLRLIAVPRHFALFVPEGQLRRERGKKDRKHCYITWTSPTWRQAKKNNKKNKDVLGQQ